LLNSINQFLKMKKFNLLIALLICSAFTVSAQTQTFTRLIRFSTPQYTTDTTASLANRGRIWFDFTTNEFRANKEGINFSIGSGSGSGGITNGAIANELMKSNGTNAVSSGLFSTSDGSINLGSSSISGDRTIAVASSSGSSNMLFTSKVNGTFQFRSSSNSYSGIEISPLFLGIKALKPVSNTTGGDLYLYGADGISGNTSGGDVRPTAGNAFAGSGDNGGSVRILAGNGDGAGSKGSIILSNYVSLLLGGTTPGSAGGSGYIYIAEATSIPTGNPTGGGVLYVEGGALKYRSPGGTITTIANN
jgi:hypothetical protein